MAKGRRLLISRRNPTQVRILSGAPYLNRTITQLVRVNDRDNCFVASSNLASPTIFFITWDISMKYRVKEYFSLDMNRIVYTPQRRFFGIWMDVVFKSGSLFFVYRTETLEEAFEVIRDEIDQYQKTRKRKYHYFNPKDKMQNENK